MGAPASGPGVCICIYMLHAHPPNTPTLTLGEEGSWPTEPDPTHGSEPKDPRDYESPGGLLMKVSTVDKGKVATETGEDGSSLSDSTTALLCCILFIFSTTCLTFVVHMFWRLRALYKLSSFYFCCCDCRGGGDDVHNFATKIVPATAETTRMAMMQVAAASGAFQKRGQLRHQSTKFRKPRPRSSRMLEVKLEKQRH